MDAITTLVNEWLWLAQADNEGEILQVFDADGKPVAIPVPATVKFPLTLKVLDINGEVLEHGIIQNCHPNETLIQ